MRRQFSIALLALLILGCADSQGNFIFTDGGIVVLNDPPPICVDDAYGATRNTPLNVDAANGVLNNDSPTGLTAGFPTASAQGGTVAGNGDGSFTYTPLADFVGTDTFTYDATGPTGTVTCTVTITVSVPPPFFSQIQRVSDAVDGAQGDGDSGSGNQAITQSGSFVVFASRATNLLGPGNPTNALGQLFVRDQNTGALEVVSLSDAGVEADASSQTPTISADGRFVAFRTTATNLLGPGNDTNGQTDIYLYDRTNDTIQRVSTPVGGGESNGFNQTPGISNDGQFIVWESDADNLEAAPTNGFSNIYLFDRVNNILTRVSRPDAMTEADSASRQPSISGDGRFIAFASLATNLVGAGNDTNGFQDVFVADRTNGTIELVSVSSAGVQGNGTSQQTRMSLDGRFVAFISSADNLLGPGNDTNAEADIFVFDRETDMIERVSVASDGTEADDSSSDPRLSDDGRFVAFSSRATNLLGPGNDTNGFTDHFVFDRQTRTIERVSVAIDNSESDGSNVTPDMSGDGRFIIFSSVATNLLGPGTDTNGFRDVFVTVNPFRP